MLTQLKGFMASVALGALMLSGAPASAEQEGAAVSKADQQFVTDAAADGLAEVRLGQLATQRAASDEVKQFGRRMVEDHTKTNNQLADIATQKGISIPTSLKPEHEELADRLRGLSGEAFDRAYMQNMVKDHDKAVSNFEKEAKTGRDRDIRSFADSQLPVLRDHLEQARDLAS